MATAYIDPVFKEPPVAFPTSGIHFLRIKHVTQAAYSQAASDYIKLTYLPKGASIVPELCSIFSDDSSDPGNAGMTLDMVATDGTTTKTIVNAQAVDAVNTRVVASAATIAALKFFKTSNNDFYVKSTVAVADAIAARNIYYVIAYTMDGGRSEVIT